MAEASTPKLCLVTGASGFVGLALVEALISAGYSVATLCRSRAPVLKRMGAKVLEYSPSNPIDLSEVGPRITYVFHLAGNAAFGNGKHYEAENVSATLDVLDSLKTCPNIKRFVYVSTIGAVDRHGKDPCNSPLVETDECFPTSDYGISKLKAEKLVEESGLPFTIVRPGMVVGNRMRPDSHLSKFLRDCAAGTSVTRIDLPGKFSIVSDRDLAQALILCAEAQSAEGQLFHCCSDHVVLGELFKRYSVTKLRLPVPRLAVYFARHLGWLMPFKMRAVLLPALVLSSKKLMRLGWQPQEPISLILDDLYLREQGRIDSFKPQAGITVITGAASGLGLAFAQRLSPIREKLILIDVNEGKLSDVAARLKNASYLVADLSDRESLEKMLTKLSLEPTPINEVYACAGVGGRGKWRDVSIESQLNVLDVNFTARLQITHHFLNDMRHRGHGRILIVSSSSAFQPLPIMGTYSALNSALVSLGVAWGWEAKSTGVRVLTICPGGMATNFQHANGVKFSKKERLMDPRLVVEQTLRAFNDESLLSIISTRSQAMYWLSKLTPIKLSVAFWGRAMERLR